MPTSLSPYPNLEQLKKQAKDLRRAHGEGSSVAAQRLSASVQRLAGLDEAGVLAADLALRDAQHVIARELGFAGWQELRKEFVDQEEPRARQLIVDSLNYSHDRLVPVQIIRAQLCERSEGQPCFMILLRDEADRVVTISIGEPEGSILTMVLSGREFARPLAHEVMEACLSHLGTTVHRLVIHSIVDTTFLAHIQFETAAGKEMIVDTRPSDGLILAARRGAPLFVTAQLMDEAGCPLVEAIEVVTKMQVEEEESG